MSYGPSPGIPARSLCGVRFTRGGAVRFVDAAGHDLAPGQFVVTDGREGARIATVVVGSGQVIEVEGEVQVVGRVRRIASQEDVRAFGRRTAQELGVTSRAAAPCAEAGAEIADAWLTPDGARALIVLRGAIPHPDALARSLAALLGIDVAIWWTEGEAAIPGSGVEGAGLPAGWDEWLVPPGAPPRLEERLDETPEPFAGRFIEKLFPSSEV